MHTLLFSHQWRYECIHFCLLYFTNCVMNASTSVFSILPSTLWMHTTSAFSPIMLRMHSLLSSLFYQLRYECIHFCLLYFTNCGINASTSVFSILPSTLWMHTTSAFSPIMLRVHPLLSFLYFTKYVTNACTSVVFSTNYVMNVYTSFFSFFTKYVTSAYPSVFSILTSMLIMHARLLFFSTDCVTNAYTFVKLFARRRVDGIFKVHTYMDKLHLPR